MLTRTKLSTACTLVVALALVLGLAACGGGGGGGGNTLPEFLALASLRVGNLNGGLENPRPYPTVPQGGVPLQQGASPQIAAPLFTPGVPGSQDFIELTFNVPVMADTVIGSGGAGTDGVVLFRNLNGVATPVPLAFDANGTLNGANVFPQPGTAPAVLKLYYDPDDDLSTPDSLPSGDYTLHINNNLKSFLGGPFCTGQGSDNCVNTILPIFPIAIGNADTSALAMAAGNPSFPVNGDPAVPVNSEITLNFAEAVDFVTLVGAANLTTLDPFITQPIPMAGVACGGLFLSLIGNLSVVYNPPTDANSGVQSTLPANLGYVVYMPDPTINPTQVKIRFVDTTTLTGAGANQNYASNPVKLPIQGASGILQRPSILPVPGSFPGFAGPGSPQAGTLGVLVTSNAFTAPSPPLPAAVNGCLTPNNGATDRAGNVLTTDFAMQFTWAAGAPVANNPMPPDATIIGTQSGNEKGLAILNTAPAMTDVAGPGTNTSVPAAYGTSPTGVMLVEPNRLANEAVLGRPDDLAVGLWVNTTTGNNNITNPGRGSVNRPGVPDDPNGTTPTSLLTLVGFCQAPCPPLQPWGNFLYVVDGDAGTVKVFNAYNWQLITTLTGVASPRGLGLSPNAFDLYVTNYDQGSVTRVFSNPAVPQFHTINNLIPVGAGPIAVAVQGQNRDLFVAEFIGNSYSRVTVGSQSVRVTVSTGLGPTEIAVGLQMLGMGLTNAYLAYCFNQFDNSVSVFEEDTPAEPSNDPNGKEVAREGGFESPRRGCWNWQTYIAGSYEPGVFVANTQGTSIDELTLFQFALSPPPGIQGLPGFRRFHLKKSYTGISGGTGSLGRPSDVSVDSHSGLYNVFAAGVTNNKSIIDPIFNGSGAVPTLTLVSFPNLGTVAAYDYNSTSLLGQVSVPGCDIMEGYYDQ